jgi:hypothetical protein
MPATSLLHASGARLGVEPGVDPRRAEERLLALRGLVDAALAQPPRAVLFAGGLLGAAVVDGSRLEAAEQQLQRLKQAGIPLVAAASSEEQRGRGPTAIEWLASRGLLQLLAAEQALELETGLCVVGSQASDHRKPRRWTGRQQVLLSAAPPAPAAGQAENFAYVAVGGCSHYLELSSRVHDAGPLVEAAPGHKPVFLRVQLRSAGPSVTPVASGAPVTEIVELDVTGLEQAEQVATRLKPRRGRQPARRVLLRLVGEPGWSETELDRRALAGHASRLLGGCEVQVQLATALRLRSGRWIPADADLDTMEQAVLADLEQQAAPEASIAGSLAELAAQSLTRLLSREDGARQAVAEAIEQRHKMEPRRAD